MLCFCHPGSLVVDPEPAERAQGLPATPPPNEGNLKVPRSGLVHPGASDNECKRSSSELDVEQRMNILESHRESAFVREFLELGGPCFHERFDDLLRCAKVFSFNAF